jgi:hypothetical protein
MVEATNHSGHYRIEAETLDEDMTAADLAFALEHLQFGKNGLAPLKLDREVARYLVSALRRD